MKKLACILLALTLIGCDSGYKYDDSKSTNMKLISSEHLTGNRNIQRICIDGYEYIALRAGYGVGLTQRFKNSNGGHLLAVECK